MWLFNGVACKYVISSSKIFLKFVFIKYQAKIKTKFQCGRDTTLNLNVTYFEIFYKRPVKYLRLFY